MLQMFGHAFCGQPTESVFYAWYSDYLKAVTFQYSRQQPHRLVVAN